MADTGAPWNIPYVEPSDLVRDYPAADEAQANAIAAALSAAVPANGFLYAGTRYYEESGSFLKADPFGTGDIGVRAIKVRMVGGGGGGGRVSGGRAAGGGGANYAESFITDMASVSPFAPVTVGSGGAGGNVSPQDGADGGTSSFDAPNPEQVVATGGGGGGSSQFGEGGSQGLPGSIGQFISIGGGSGGAGGNNDRPSAAGGSSLLGGGAREGRSSNNNVTGSAGTQYGGGGGGAKDNRSGGSGADGIVIIDVFV